MYDPERQPKFEIQSIIERTPFKSLAVQSFFTKWCEINDSIQPQIINRDEWEKKKQEGGILERRPGDKQTLFIPPDLQFWEMIGVMETVDRDTFANKPERQTEAKEKLLGLAEIFQNTGIYIARRVGEVREGRSIAEAFAKELYEYGRSLSTNKKPEPSPNIRTMASYELTPKETEEVDRFLAGESLYASREKRVGRESRNNPSRKEGIYEAKRRETLAQFFKVAEKAFLLEKKNMDGELREKSSQLKPWQSDTPIHSAFLERVSEAIRRELEAPKRGLEMAIFRRGLEKLVTEMRETLPMRDKRTGKITPGWKTTSNSFLTKLGFNPIVEQKRLADILRIPELKTELETIRRKGDPAQMGRKEREIADKIQEAVSSFPYSPWANNPSEMVAKQYINCVGASTLGGALMKEAGLHYLVGDVPEHSFTFLVTSDGVVEWRDFLSAWFKRRLDDKILEGKHPGGGTLTVADIIAFSKRPSPRGLTFDLVNPDNIEGFFPWTTERQPRRSVSVFGPEHGQQIQILNNTGAALYKLGFYKEAVEAYRQATTAGSNNAGTHNNMGNTFLALGRDEEAIAAYRQAIAIDPKFAVAYGNLGNTLLNKLHHEEEAIEAYRQAIAIEPKYASAHHNMGTAFYDLNLNEEAIAAFQRAIAVDPKYPYPHNGLGITFSRLGRHEEAIAAYRQAIAIDPKFAVAYGNLGNTLANLGRKKEAIGAYRKFISLADKTKDAFLIKQTKRKIGKLEDSAAPPENAQKSGSTK